VLTPTHTIGAQFDPTKKRLGVGQHPHRGFETVTVAFQGAVEHQDSTGNNDVIGPGDVQWMTAGRGIIHEEYHSTEFAKSGGIFEMCQLWGNDSNPNPEPNPNPNPNPTNPNPNILSPTRARAQARLHLEQARR